MFDWLYGRPTRVLVATVVVAPVAMVVAFSFAFPYRLPAMVIAVLVLATTIAVACGGFELARRFLKPHIVPHEGINDAFSGALGAIGVFYGVTVGLIAIDVWQRHANAEDIAAREAAAIQVLYLMVKSDIGAIPGTAPSDAGSAHEGTKSSETKDSLPLLVSDYLQQVVCFSWENQKEGAQPKSEDWKKLRDIRREILKTEPAKDGQKVRYDATIRSINHLSELQRLRSDAANDRLSWVMWMIIILGALMSMCVAYLFHLENSKLHLLVVGLLSAFLGLVLLMILLNHRPFLGPAGLDHWPFLGGVGVDSQSYEDVGWIIKNAHKDSAPKAAANALKEESGDKDGKTDWPKVCAAYRPDR